MTTRTWIIFGATSIIAEHFAHEAAKSGHALLLVGRDEQQLAVLVKDISIRYQVTCDWALADFASPNDKLIKILDHPTEVDLLLAYSDFTDNQHLNKSTIKQLIQINILSTALLIDAYLRRNQSEHHLLYLSSVAACRGRAKNSLYGASKAAIEVYLEGLQQAAADTVCITIARLGFIDTKHTYGVPGVFYAAPPAACARACWQAVLKKKKRIYFPFFWRGIMAVISALPFFIYKKLKGA